jgi:hypothetical protein
MKNEKDTLMGDSMSRNQMSPGLADPNDFVISKPDEFATRYTEFGGQCGENEREYEKLLKQADSHGKSPLGAQSEVHPNVNGAGHPHTPGMSGDDDE